MSHIQFSLGGHLFVGATLCSRITTLEKFRAELAALSK